MAYKDVVLADSPVSYWRLDETTGTNAVDQQAAHAGTYTGTFTLNQPGALAGDSNAAVSLAGGPGGGYLATGWNPFVVGAQQTFEGWAFARVAPTNTVLFGATTGATEPNLFFDSATQVSFYPRNNTKIAWAASWPGTSQWVHWVLTWDDTAKVGELFINGVSQGAKTATESYAGTGGNMQLGADTAIATFPGSVDEAAIYSTLLSASRVLAHYNAGKTYLESLTVTDTPVVKGPSQPVVSEAVTVTDTPALFGGAQPKPSESITVSDTPLLKGGAQPKPSESLTVTDTPAVFGGAQAKPSEALAVSETAAVVVVVAVSKSEAVTLTEAVTVQGPAQPNVSEALTVTDTPTVQGPAQPVTSEAVTVSESTAVQVLVAVAASQAVTVTDTPAVFLPRLTQAVAESVTVTDTPVLKGGAQPVVSDAVTLSETTVAELVSFIAASQAVTVSETVAVQIAGGTALSISASETLSVTETLTPILPYLLVSTADTLAATDTPAVKALIRVAASEQITVSTTVRFPINYIDAQSGTLIFAGSATSSIGPDLNVTWKRQHLYYVDYRNWVRGP